MIQLVWNEGKVLASKFSDASDEFKELFYIPPSEQEFCTISTYDYGCEWPEITLFREDDEDLLENPLLKTALFDIIETGQIDPSLGRKFQLPDGTVIEV